jgi:hypothetical protein
MINYKIAAVYILAYYIVFFMMMVSRILIVLIRTHQKADFSLGPVNGVPFLIALKGYDYFTAECRQLGYTAIIGTALNLVLGFFG